MIDIVIDTGYQQHLYPEQPKANKEQTTSITEKIGGNIFEYIFSNTRILPAVILTIVDRSKIKQLKNSIQTVCFYFPCHKISEKNIFVMEYRLPFM